MTQSKPVVLVCGDVFDGVSEGLSGSGEIPVRDGKIAEVADQVSPPPNAEVVDLSERTVMPGFIDTHVHLPMDASDLVSSRRYRRRRASGALRAVREGMDLLGVLVVAAVTAIGGGTVRDLLLDELVFWLADTSYLYAIAAAAVCTLVYGRFRRPQHATLLVAYAIGPAVFAVLWAHTRGR